MSIKELNWEVQPFKRFGPLVFGSRSEQVRDVLGKPVKRYKKSKFSIGFTEMYVEDGDPVMVEYDEEDNVVAVEVTPPYDPHVEDVLLKSPAGKVERQLSELGYAAEKQQGIMKFGGLGVRLYSPSEDSVESITAHSESYESVMSKVRKRMFESMGM